MAPWLRAQWLSLVKQNKEYNWLFMKFRTESKHRKQVSMERSAIKHRTHNPSYKAQVFCNSEGKLTNTHIKPAFPLTDISSEPDSDE